MSFSSDLPEDAVRGKLGEVEKTVQEAKKQHPGSTSAKGAAIWLVPTFKPIEEWQPIAKRDLPRVEWSWET